MKYRIVGNHVDPYTWEVCKLDIVIEIKSEESARRWAKQSYYKCTVNRVEKIL